MKNTKTKPLTDVKSMKAKQIQMNHGAFGATVSVPLVTGQVTTLMRLAADLKDPDEGRVAARVFSLGLFVLGLDRTGDAGLGQITDAMHGKGSDAAATLYNAITDAGSGALDEIENAERERREQAFAKPEEAGA